MEKNTCDIRWYPSSKKNKIILSIKKKKKLVYLYVKYKKGSKKENCISTFSDQFCPTNSANPLEGPIKNICFVKLKILRGFPQYELIHGVVSGFV